VWWCGGVVTVTTVIHHCHHCHVSATVVTVGVCKRVVHVCVGGAWTRENDEVNSFFLLMKAHRGIVGSCNCSVENPATCRT
jgi:uncharacterized membrane protein YpjA